MDTALTYVSLRRIITSPPRPLMRAKRSVSRRRIHCICLFRRLPSLRRNADAAPFYYLHACHRLLPPPQCRVQPCERLCVQGLVGGWVEGVGGCTSICRRVVFLLATHGGAKQLNTGGGRHSVSQCGAKMSEARGLRPTAMKSCKKAHRMFFFLCVCVCVGRAAAAVEGGD